MAEIFSDAEIQRRQDKLRTLIGDCDAAVTFSFTNSYYMSGAEIVQWGRPTITVIPKEGEPAYICSGGDKDRAFKQSNIKNVIDYSDSDGPNVPRGIQLLSDLLKEKGIKKIGVDSYYATNASIELLRKNYPELVIEDISAVLDEMRSVNSDEELKYIRMATDIADYGVKTWLESAKLNDVTEVELAGIASHAMSVYAAEKYPAAETKPHIYSQQGLRSMQQHTGASGEPLTGGQLMVVVVECWVWSYQASVERCIALGETNKEQEDHFNAILAAHATECKAVRPGLKFNELNAIGVGEYEKRGYTNNPVGTGLLRSICSEFEGRLDCGNIRTYNENTLKPGMVLTIEPWTAVPTVGSPRHCDMVLVTEDGYEVLSKAPAGFLTIK